MLKVDRHLADTRLSACFLFVFVLDRFWTTGFFLFWLTDFICINK